jgi:hypothetical protein
MKRLFSWQVGLSVGLMSLSALVYYLHYLLFRDVHHIFLYLVGDVAFVFVEVLLVTIIIHELLGLREKQALLQKLNMVIGAFFSEVGLSLLRIWSVADERSQALGEALVVSGRWSAKDFEAASRRLAEQPCVIRLERVSLEELKAFLTDKRDFLLRLLENPNLLEHESFTDALWSVFHLAEELEHRTDVSRLSRSDLAHLSGDMRRCAAALAVEWLDYVRHLKESYPYLFSLAVRRNPLDPAARVEFADERA